MFRFVYEGENYSNHLSFGEDETLTHEEVAVWFNQFLRGVGYRYDGEYVQITEEEESILAQYDRAKKRDAFIQSAFGDDLNDNEAGSAFPVI